MKILNINKSYDGKKVVKNITLDIPKNKITSFIGPNGAGKSTLLNVITRLIKRDSGDIMLDGKDIKDYKSNELSKKIAILTQTNNISMKLTVRELVAFGRFPYSGSNLTTEDNLEIDKAIEYMGLEEFQTRFIDELSGGQRQRAYIAMVIAQNTEYIFLDEPTNNLDIFHASNMMKMVKKLCDDLGKTVVLVLHEINFAATYSDYIAAFKNGELYKYGTVDEIMNKEVLKELYQVDFEILTIKGKPLSLYY